jgi:hypothetical protein
LQEHPGSVIVVGWTDRAELPRIYKGTFSRAKTPWAPSRSAGPASRIPAGRSHSLRLRLVQSIPRFAKDGKVRFLLAEPHDQGTHSPAGLKFDLKSPDGLGKEVFKVVHPLGSGTFTRVKTGQADTFALTPD